MLGLVEIDIIFFMRIISKRVIIRAIVIAGTIRVSVLLFLNKPCLLKLDSFKRFFPLKVIYL